MTPTGSPFPAAEILRPGEGEEGSGAQLVPVLWADTVGHLREGALQSPAEEQPDEAPRGERGAHGMWRHPLRCSPLPTPLTEARQPAICSGGFEGRLREL